MRAARLKSFSLQLFVISLAVASLMGGCGPEMSNSPAMTDNQNQKKVGFQEVNEPPTASEIFRGRRADTSGPDAAPSIPGSRLDTLREQIDGGANPESVEILYAALSDPEPEVREAVSEWLRLFVEQDSEARERVKLLRSREPSREVWFRTEAILTPHEEPAEEEAVFTEEIE